MEKPTVSDTCEVMYIPGNGTKAGKFKISWSSGGKTVFLTPAKAKEHFAAVVDDMEGEGELDDDV